MSNDSLQKFAEKKAFEIAYATERLVSAISTRATFAGELESHAIKIISGISEGDFKSSHRAAATLEYLMRLGGDAGIFNSGTAQVILAELKNFVVLVSELEAMSSEPAAVDFGKIFSAVPANFDKPSVTRGDETREYKANRQNVSAPAQANGNGNGSGNAANRQSAIIAAIKKIESLPGRQDGCRLKDIQDVLSNVSERTIRYDLQNIMGQGIIERVGNGGPATFYRMKSKDTALVAGSSITTLLTNEANAHP